MPFFDLDRHVGELRDANSELILLLNRIHAELVELNSTAEVTFDLVKRNVGVKQ